MRLLLRDPAYTDRLAAFLRSVGQQPIVSAPDHIEVYLSVWRVLYPGAEVVINLGP